MILKIVFSSIEFSNINFYINSMNIIIVIMKSLTKLDFYNFTFSIIKDTLIKIIIKKKGFVHIRKIIQILFFEINE